MSSILRSFIAMALGASMILIGFAGTAGDASAQYEPATPLTANGVIADNGGASGAVMGGQGPYTVTAVVGGVTATATVAADGTFSFPAGTFPANVLSVALTVTDAAGTVVAGSASRSFADPLPAPGPFSNSPDTLSGTVTNDSLNITENSRAFEQVMAAAPAGSGGGAGGQLAFTGAQSNMLIAGGMGLVLVGGAAMVAARKRD